MVEVCAVFCSCLLWLDAYRCMYMAHVCFYVCCSDCVGVCENVCCVAVAVKNSVCIFVLEC